MPRRTRTPTTRDPRTEIASARSATQRAVAEIQRSREHAEIKAAIETDELETGREWATGAAAFRATAQDLDGDPWQGLRQTVELWEKAVERIEERLKHAGTEKAQAGANRTLAHAEAQLAAARERLWSREENAVGELLNCRARDCDRTVGRKLAFSTCGFCLSCYRRATEASRIPNDNPN